MSDSQQVHVGHRTSTVETLYDCEIHGRRTSPWFDFDTAGSVVLNRRACPKCVLVPLLRADEWTPRRCLCNVDSDGTPIYPDGQGAEDCPCCRGRGTVLVPSGQENEPDV